MRRLRGVVLSVAFAFAASACSVNPTSGVAPPTVSKRDLEPGSRYLLKAEVRPALPRLRGDALAGPPIDVSDLRGHVVVLNVWASWCAPCRAEAPQLAAVWRKTSPRGVKFVGIAIKDDAAAARAFERTFKVPYRSIFDPSGRLLLALRGLAPQAPPSTFLVDRKGRLAARFAGGVTQEQLLGPVEQLAAQGS